MPKLNLEDLIAEWSEVRVVIGNAQAAGRYSGTIIALFTVEHCTFNAPPRLTFQGAAATTLKALRAR